MRPGSLLLLCLCSWLLVTVLTRCRQAYNPPALQANNNYLVVDGFINTGANAVTTFNLSTSVNLNDTTTAGKPVFDATVAIVASNGQTWPLVDTGNNGTYVSAPLNLDLTQQYRISISTQNGQKYTSDPVPCTQTPPIDSVWWRQPYDLDLNVTTHAPAGNTRYYRYDYIETWQHDAELQSPWTVVNGMIQATDSADQLYECWTTDSSSTVLLATSAALTQNLISGYTVNTIPNGDARLAIGYSILVRQYAVSEDAYNYWQLIQKTTDNIGTLFDIQPTQLIGNIHCTTNPTQPVIGFISATSMQQQRLSVLHDWLNNWPKNEPGNSCDTMTLASTTTGTTLIWPNPGAYWWPWYFDLNGQLVVGSRFCLDCTYSGGTNIRPSFWPWQN